MFLKLNSLYPDFGLHDSWPFCHALFSRKFLFIFSITCLTFYSWSFFAVSLYRPATLLDYFFDLPVFSYTGPYGLGACAGSSFHRSAGACRISPMFIFASYR